MYTNWICTHWTFTLLINNYQTLSHLTKYQLDIFPQERWSDSEIEEIRDCGVDQEGTESNLLSSCPLLPGTKHETITESVVGREIPQGSAVG